MTFTTTTSLADPLDGRTLRDAFGTFPSGVVAVGAQVRGRLVGLAASSFTSVSIEPPLVSFAVAVTSSTWPLLREADHLGISVLADHHDEVCRQLAGPAEARFDGLPCEVTRDGAVLLREAVAAFDCTIHEEVSAGDHVIVLLALHGITAGDGEHPLVFHRSGFATLDRGDIDQARLRGRINGQPVEREVGATDTPTDTDTPTERDHHEEDAA